MQIAIEKYDGSLVKLASRESPKFLFAVQIRNGPLVENAFVASAATAPVS